MKRLIPLLLLAVFVPSLAFGAAAGSCTFSEAGVGSKLIEMTYVCTSDGSGNVTDPTITSATGSSATKLRTGVIQRVQIIPGTSTDAPSSNYNVYLYSNNDTGATNDILGGMGTTLSATATKSDAPLTATNGYPRFLSLERLIPKATGMGASKKTTIKVLYSPY